jgi:hypothetical protein
MSTAHHPQTDGQSEREIRTLITALRSFCNDHQDDWDDILPMLELGFNTAVQASTQRSPYELLYGQQPRTPLDVALDPLLSRVPAAKARADSLREGFEFARGKLVQAQQRQARNADRHRRTVQLNVGDEVLLSTEGLRLRGQNNKLCSPFVGPFVITEVINSNAFRLALPPQMEALHPVFNISRLKPYVANSADFATRPQRFDRPPPEAQTDSNGDALWQVDRVLACKKVGRGKRYLVAWKGYPPEENTWESHASISHTTAFEIFQAAQLAAADAFMLTIRATTDEGDARETKALPAVELNALAADLDRTETSASPTPAPVSLPNTPGHTTPYQSGQTGPGHLHVRPSGLCYPGAQCFLDRFCGSQARARNATQERRTSPLPLKIAGAADILAARHPSPREGDIRRGILALLPRASNLNGTGGQGEPEGREPEGKGEPDSSTLLHRGLNSPTTRPSSSTRPARSMARKGGVHGTQCWENDGPAPPCGGPSIHTVRMSTSCAPVVRCNERPLGRRLKSDSPSCAPWAAGGRAGRTDVPEHLECSRLLANVPDDSLPEHRECSRRFENGPQRVFAKVLETV